MTIRLLGVLVLVAWLSAPALGDLNRCLAAYAQGDYGNDMEEFRAAAEQGDADAQFSLALMYGLGQGVPRNDNEAARWYRTAAAQGLAGAQAAAACIVRTGRHNTAPPLQDERISMTTISARC